MTEDTPLPSDFPWVIGRIGLTDDWSLELPLAFKLRIEDGSMVLWHPGFTIWINAWNNDHRQSIAARKEHFASVTSPDKFDERESSADGRLYYSYRLDEPSDDKRVAALYASVFAENGHLQMSFYFDDEEEAGFAYEILASANGEPPTLADPRIYSQLCFATNMVMEDGLAVGYMCREQPDFPRDSGWRFFAGRESQAYVDDPRNTQVYPVAFVAEINPEIIPHLLAEAGSELEWNGEAFGAV